MTEPFRIVPAGDSAVLIEFDERVDAALNAHCAAVAAALAAAAVAGVRDIVPAIRSVAVYFDPLKTDRDRLEEAVRASAGTRTTRAALPPARIDVPVCYDPQFGLDLAEVARFGDTTEGEVIALHTGVTYQVFMMGFLPGFAYMGTVTQRIAAPRRESPRPRVAAGSVGIAGTQTGIYPLDTPGGWQIIGRTPLAPFDLTRPLPFLFNAGDSVRFHPIDVAEYTRLARAGVASA
jgi:inhibitor of KinA